MKDSFLSFKDANITSWIVNVRGSHAHLAEEFLKQNISRMSKISCIESGKGWFHDTSILVQDIDSGYVLYWIEDHINTASIETLNSVINEISRSGIDQIQYSFFNRAKYDLCEGICIDENQHFRIMDFSNNTWDKYLSRCNDKGLIDPYLISLVSIMSIQCFKSVLSKRDPVLRRHSKHTPFDFEKDHGDVHWLPLKTGFLSTEIFACIDTDHDGLSLISRGLYKDAKAQVSNELANATSGMITNSYFILVKKLIHILVPETLRNLLKRLSFHLE